MIKGKILKNANYLHVLNTQKHIREQRILNQVPNTVLFVEHNPAVFTIGKRDNLKDILKPEDDIKREYNIDIHKIDRGGAVTYHGPGQLVVYPIFQLGENNLEKSIPKYIQRMEKVMIDTCRDFGVLAHAKDKEKVGVWVNERKIGFLGFHFQSWVSIHGFSLNVCNELSIFKEIVSCGLKEVEITSLEMEVSKNIPFEDVLKCCISNFEKEFGKITFE